MKEREFREIVVRADVTLPMISTDQPERQYAFVAFLYQWVLDAPQLRKDENLEFLFEWEDAIKSFCDETEKAVALDKPVAPTLPGKPSSPAEAQQLAAEFNASMEQYREDCKPYEAQLSAVRVGKRIFISDEAFLAAKTAAKSALDEALTRNPMGQQLLSASYGPTVLRHYHAFSQSKKVPESALALTADKPRAEA
jgi:hypothetical protein